MAISLRNLTRGHSVELADSLSKLVLSGIVSRSEARAELGLIGTDSTSTKGGFMTLWLGLGKRGPIWCRRSVVNIKLVRAPIIALSLPGSDPAD